MKVLLVEDDAKLSRFLARVLAEESYGVELCPSGQAALASVDTEAPDIIILDWMLPDCDGISICRDVRRRSPDIPILMLTARGELSDRVTGLESGADDYLAKPFEVEELLARLRALLRRSNLRHVTLGSLRIDLQRRKILSGDDSIDLTAREFDLFAHLFRSGGQIVTRLTLLAAVWSTSVDPGTNLVEVHLSRLRTKLGPEAWRIETVRGEGYRLRLEASR